MAQQNIPLLNLKKIHDLHRGEIMAALAGVLDHGQFVGGPEVRAFEEAFARWLGDGLHCAAVGNGTDAIALAIKACQLAGDSEVILPAMTFIATAEGVLNAGLRIKLVDVDEGTWLMNPGELAAAISPRTKLVIPVHLYGQMPAMDEIQAVAERSGCKVIEDASQAHGATWKGRPVGSWSEAATFSFFPGKNLGALGDSGGVVSRSSEFALRVSALAKHGGLKKYEHLIAGGTNSRMDTFQAAVLLLKLRRLKEWNAAREAVANGYYERLSDIAGLRLPARVPHAKHVYHLFVVLSERRDELAAFLKEKGIETGVHYPKAIHQLPAYRDTLLAKGKFPNAEKLSAFGLSLPMCPTMTLAEVDQVSASIGSFFKGKP